MSARDEVAQIERARELLEELGYIVRDRIEEAELARTFFEAGKLYGALHKAATDFLSDPNDWNYKKALRAALSRETAEAGSAPRSDQ